MTRRVALRRFTRPAYPAAPAGGVGYPGGVLERWTGVVLRHRVLVLGFWLVVLIAGVLAAAQLPAKLSVSFSVPGTESNHARELLAGQFGEQPDGTFVVVFEVPRSSDAAKRVLRKRLAEAAQSVPTGRTGALTDGDGILYASIGTMLSLDDAKSYTNRVRAALGEEGARAYVTGEPAIQHDLDPIVREDTQRAELIAIPIALVVLVAMFGLTPAVLIPLLFAACTIGATFAVLRMLVEVTAMTTYVTALVELIGLGLAIDYSLLIVHRYREECAHGVAIPVAVGRAMSSAGRTVVFSGLAVAIGLSVLLLVPVPLIRSLGIAGLLVPLISIAAVLTLQPVLLSLLGRAGASGSRDERAERIWSRFATAVMRRPAAVLVIAVSLLALLSIPALSLRLTPGTLSGIPARPEAMAGFERLSEGVGPGAVTPIHVVVEAGKGGTSDGPTRAAIDRLADDLFHDPEVLLVASGSRKPYVDAAHRYARVIVVGRHEVGADETQRLVKRLRNELIPDSRFPGRVAVSTGGAPAQGVDFLDRAYDAILWIVLLVLVVTYVVLLRAFRSLLASTPGGAPQPADGVGRVRAPGSRLPVGARGATRASERRTRSRAGSRCSCSRPSSACRWTTRSSSSRACAKPGTSVPTPHGPSPRASSDRAASSRLPRSS